MRISRRVYLTASGRMGCSLSRAEDCNAYAVDCGGPVLLIDSGVGGAGSITANLKQDGVDLARVEALLLTHGHLDHSGGAAALHRELGVPVWCSLETAQALEAGDEAAISLAAAKQAGVYPESLRLESCPVARKLQESSEPIRIGDVTLQVLRTPGHSHDMLTYLIETDEGLLAFVGDTVFHNGRVLLSPNWDCDPLDCAASLRKLAALPIDGLYPGHSIWSVREGRRQVEAALPYVDRLLVPPNLF